MKVTRCRRVRRNLKFYINNFEFRSPYQILIDATFCKAALECKLNIQEQMPKYLDTDVKLLTTSCVIIEAELIGPPAYGAMLIVKQFQLRQCGHKKPIPASECLYSMLKNDNADHYFIATQDTELSDKVRELANVPLLYVKYNAIILEKPSVSNIAVAQVKMEEKLAETDYHTEVVKELKKQTFGHETAPIKQRKRKIKGANPLSCKKKKKKDDKTPKQEKIRQRSRHKRSRKLDAPELTL